MMHDEYDYHDTCAAFFDLLLNRLTTREMYVICRLYLNNEQPKLAEMADVLKVSKERVRQIESKALNKIKSCYRHYPNLMLALKQDFKESEWHEGHFRPMARPFINKYEKEFSQWISHRSSNMHHFFSGASHSSVQFITAT